MFAMPYTGAFPSLTQLGSSFRARTEYLRSCTQRLEVIITTTALEHKANIAFTMPLVLGSRVQWTMMHQVCNVRFYPTTCGFGCLELLAIVVANLCESARCGVLPYNILQSSKT